MAGADQPLAARLVALAASAVMLAVPGVARAEGNQEAGVGQVSEAAAVAGVFTPVRGGACFAGCPTIVVSEPVGIAVSFNIAAVVQMLNQPLGL